jgi:hypothetical protein
MRNLLALTTVCLLIIFGTVAINAQNDQADPQYGAQNAAPVASGPQIPAGTQLAIRTNEKIDATKDDIGHMYSGEISQDVMGPNGGVLIPKGSPVELTIANVSSGTLGVQSNEAALALHSISVNGRKYLVASNEVTQGNNRGIGANKRTAEMTGGGALLGTVIGAVAGGGKGAALGGLAGAGAGATAQVLTRGKNVQIPAESVVTFKLDQPVQLQ